MIAMPIRHSLSEVAKVANLIRYQLGPFTDRIEIVGSVRRRRPFPKDVEVLFIPKYRVKTSDLFSAKASTMDDLVDAELARWIADGRIRHRHSVIGSPTWGKENKYAVHSETDIAINFFATTHDNWWNALVMRTGGKQNNINISSAARRRGWTFEACGSGLSSLRGLPHHQTTSERDVFEFVGLEYLEPENRP